MERQAEDRAHRIGREGPVMVYRYVIEDTIEQRIDELIASKQQLFDTVVDRTSMDLRSVLSAEELFRLFDLHATSARS